MSPPPGDIVRPCAVSESDRALWRQSPRCVTQLLSFLWLTVLCQTPCAAWHNSESDSMCSSEKKSDSMCCMTHYWVRLHVLWDILLSQTPCAVRHTTKSDSMCCETYYWVTLCVLCDTLLTQSPCAVWHTTDPVSVCCDTHYWVRLHVLWDTLLSQTLCDAIINWQTARNFTI